MKKKVVIVDDDESIRKTFYLILHSDYRVYLANDAEEALRRFAGTDVDLIIADLKLPHLDGMEMIARFRKTGYTGEVILISAYPDLLDSKMLSRLAVGRIFVKPLELEVLTKSIASLLATGDNQREGMEA